MPVLEKAVLTTREAEHYCGGKSIFEGLRARFPDLLVPFAIGRSTGKKADGSPAKGKTTYLKTVIDQCLKAAQVDRSFIR